MIAQGLLLSTGIVIEPNASNDLLSCCKKRQNKVSYDDILSIEERQIGHFLLKYVNRSSRPFSVATKLVKIDREENLRAISSGSSLANLNLDDENQSIEEIITSRAYAGCVLPQKRKPILVIVNPHSGSGRAAELYNTRAAPAFAAAGLATKVVHTQYVGHAKEISRDVSIEDHDTIVCVSGDGLPHEVLNGLASRASDSAEALRHFGIAQLPGGSGNAMCLSLNDGVSDWAAVALGIIKGIAEPWDIMGISQGSDYFYSFLSQSYGIVADCDLGTEDLRWMGGARFTVGIVYKCLAGNKYPCEIAYKELDPRAGAASSAPQEHGSENTTEPTPRLTVADPVPSDWKVEKHNDLSMFYVGKMRWMSADALVFPECESLDGAMDMIVWDNSFGSIKALTALTKFETGTHVDSIPFYKKVQAYRLTPLVADQLLSIDGESYPCTPLQVELIPGGARFVVPAFRSG